MDAWSEGRGVDAVIILASTPKNEPVEQAAAMCRERGRIVATGQVGLNVPRRTFYDKELELVVSRAWGPGLYDSGYTDSGFDYPLPYARWTANRNVEEFLAQLSRRSVSVGHLITHRFPIDKAIDAYDMVLKGRKFYIGVVVTYPDGVVPPHLNGCERASASITTNGAKPSSSTVWLKDRGSAKARQPGTVGVGLIGAGLFANGTLLPVMNHLKRAKLRGVATTTGLTGHHTAGKFGFDYCTTDYHELLADTSIELVCVLTRHGSHSRIASEALEAGKHVFVEKPLAINREQLRDIGETYSRLAYNALTQGLTSPNLMVGFHRRFSQFTVWLKERFNGNTGPLSVSCVVNAGSVPPDSWINDPKDGGGRIVGEVCHFIDLAAYLTSSVPVKVYAEPVSGGNSQADDSTLSTVTMTDGSIASIAYLAGGDKRYPRERVEVFGGGAVGAIENFKAASFVQGGRTQRRRNRMSVASVHRHELEMLLASINAKADSPVDFEDYVATTLATFAMEKSLKTGRPELVDLSHLSEADQAQ